MNLNPKVYMVQRDTSGNNTRGNPVHDDMKIVIKPRTFIKDTSCINSVMELKEIAVSHRLSDCDSLAWLPSMRHTLAEIGKLNLAISNHATDQAVFKDSSGVRFSCKVQG